MIRKCRLKFPFKWPRFGESWFMYIIRSPCRLFLVALETAETRCRRSSALWKISLYSHFLILRILSFSGTRYRASSTWNSSFKTPRAIFNIIQNKRFIKWICCIVDIYKRYHIIAKSCSMNPRYCFSQNRSHIFHSFIFTPRIASSHSRSRITSHPVHAHTLNHTVASSYDISYARQWNVIGLPNDLHLHLITYHDRYPPPPR